MESLRIDFQFEDSCLNNFEIFDIEGQKLEQAKFLINLAEEFENEKQFESENDPLEKYKNLNANNNFICESYKVKDCSLFLQSFEKIIASLEEFLTDLDYTSISQLINEDNFHLLKIKVWNDCKKMRFYLIKENISKSCFELHLKDGFESYGLIFKIFMT